MKTSWKQTALVRYFGFTKIPLIFFVKPSVIQLDQSQCIVKIPLRRRTRNHLMSMYFGVLAVGADLAGGLMAMQMIERSDHKISLVFKDMHADFLKRVDADAIFTCSEGDKISSLIQKVVDTGERYHQPINIQVTAPDKYGNEILATFTLTLSLKVKD
ncbi:MAG: YiiD C-terminal domain-containing protein [FCB group bacterium]|nr:YiiD C-terminal domain-containing protein [FCB group bacterium]MBL7026797.1 YiiD C-terminal domain-containing protein [Candidatus Neomarinimicrobiota bacterium]MBL7121374.1 YiiD C-terminal domain-containing protein [Candidatus Neomarinimicrobiota bacterium]